MGYIYVFEFTNGKRYVGQTMDPENRFFKCHYSGKVREAIDLFGSNNVKKHIWEVPDSQMDDLERFLISVYKSDDIEFGYNIQSGGKRCYNQSEESRRKNSESHKGEKNNMYGKHHTDEARRKMSEARKAYYAKKKGLI